jgi:hypothetical protein
MKGRSCEKKRRINMTKMKGKGRKIWKKRTEKTRKGRRE